ncbi:dTDP-4-dehydrorhamnose 3,5-epimerase [Shinella sumterensis]|uniref:dTDP-4-dehydrorhamnose 3,5-epimerase n=1 Tax=Shinella sumterensis TaxID=1967501 RepID=UPI00106E18F4|nr:dTDP-4-dehydrorhamnose 3,5-epimerase [Shinella sumterensis]MCD1262648.1 dTDP-4-dehydrorhamnose 3,5-epimerase [Shinella sumterensis]MDP9588268.1 dTDP-4-dehydrorhamnose 3,5-epimerase [Shinella zoogloeoides]TFE98775.1 dTDP-4-dehydrorhamnose 3,5-epimerase [Shinella sumterensis]
MLFTRTDLEGVWLIEASPIRDERGSFARTFCIDEMNVRGLEHRFVQHSLSRSTAKHTLRGLHFQRAPHAEVKVVSCLNGAIWDVAVDLRPQSPTYRRWTAAELSADNMRQLYIPKGCAHGFLSLTEDAVVGYLISTRYDPSAAAGLRYDDPALAIDWPAEPAVMSEKDRNWPLLADNGHHA